MAEAWVLQSMGLRADYQTELKKGTFKTGITKRDTLGDGCVFITEFKAAPLLSAGKRDRNLRIALTQYLKWGVGGVGEHQSPSGF